MTTKISVGRESGRIKDADKKKVLDVAARNRRARKALESLEMDNYQQDPHADIVLNKKAPKFLDTIESKGRRKKEKSAEYYKQKFRRTFTQLVEDDQFNNPDPPNYVSIEAPPSYLPRRIFCAVCGFPSSYTCTTCGAKYCSLSCLGTHQSTRCLKWTA
ncbi:zinc finger HIT domain-containing protein 1 [Adelges cooleyi]|uniref:zinc finger HIT domain-containing protein 1 n=1 Tax=Adelges cooleyi TaxID=133065 RepID=UPI00218067EF|nr:zinc finger HIT domain-containing protein 1 [Adelges cooleyi]